MRVRTMAPSCAGFTIVDMVVVVALVAILAGIAVPAMQTMSNAIVHGQAQQMVKSELQQARLRSVSTNRVLRVRFNCPAAGQFRMVELVGTPSTPATLDTAANRCSETVYPYPAG